MYVLPTGNTVLPQGGASCSVPGGGDGEAEDDLNVGVNAIIDSVP
jgi:hypothetical protein